MSVEIDDKNYWTMNGASQPNFNSSNDVWQIDQNHITTSPKK
jgi:hypothetical protein